MKIAFDEHVPVTLVRVFEALSRERQIRNSIGSKGFPKDLEIVAARRYAPSPLDDDFAGNSDVPWMERFAADGGTAIISGNTAMMSVPHELLAIQRLNLVAIFFQERWNNWDFFEKTSLILWHWKSIIATIKAAKPATLYRIPSNWTQKEKLTRIVGPRGELLLAGEQAPNRGAKGTRSGKRRGTTIPVEGQGSLLLGVESDSEG